MTSALLDVTVVIALIDPGHEHHDRAHRWFGAHSPAAWHTSPTVQNGAIRIVSHPRYSNSRPPAVAMTSVQSLIQLPGHIFLPDSVSLLDSEIQADRLLASSQVTDTYLLHLATTNIAVLATFDKRLVTTAVIKSAGSLILIP